MAAATLRIVKPTATTTAPVHALNRGALADQDDAVEIAAERHRAGLPLEIALAEAYNAGHEYAETEAATRHTVLGYRALDVLAQVQRDELAARRNTKAGA